MTEAYEQLEQLWSSYSRQCHSVGCANGTAALHLALETLRIPQGSQVIIPEFSMIAVARAVTAAGLMPVPVDCGSELNIDPLAIQDYVNCNTRAIIVVHTYGRYCSMDRIAKIANRHGLKLIEDCAEVGPRPPSDHSANQTQTDARCWSFYKNKIVAGEEGGMCCFKNRGHYMLARKLRCQGFTDAHDFIHIPRGFNYRLSNANARLILEHLNQVETNLELRRKIVKWYDQATPNHWKMPPRDDPWVYDLRPPVRDVAALVSRLNSVDIQARQAFKPVSGQPEYRAHYKHLRAWQYSQQVMYLPIYPHYTQNTVRTVMQAVTTSL